METIRRRQRKKAMRPGDIVDAAFLLFVKKGFHGVRIEDIARCAGLSNGALYNYFESKQEIFDAVVRVKLMPGFYGLDEFSHRDGDAASETLLRLADLLCGDDFGAELAGVLRMVIAEGLNGPAQARSFYDEFIGKMLATLSRILQTGIANGEFNRVDIPVTADILARIIMASILKLSSFTCFSAAQVNFSESRCFLRGSLEVMIGGLLRQDAG